MPVRKGRSSPLYMTHVVPGLEELAWEEVQERAGGVLRVATWSSIDRRAGVLLFRSSEPAEDLLDLRLTEDCFAVVAFTTQLPPGRRGLRDLIQLAAAGEQMETALRCHREAVAPHVRGRPTFRVIVRKAGSHAFRRVDAQRACETGLARRFPRWRLVEDDAVLEFWLQIIGEDAILALRLSSAAMRQRTYRGANLPAALKPTVAHALVRLARPRSGRLLVDPMCGTGTVLAEAAEAGIPVLGGDIELEAVRAARRNLQSLREYGRVAHWDTARLPLPDGIAGGLACNLPWGRGSNGGDLMDLYRRVLVEASRVVERGGCIALLTSQRELIERLLRGRRGLTVERRISVVVRGVDAWLVALRKSV